MPTLHIACTGADTLPYTALTEFQGELKSLSKDDFAAMKKQLTENGFSFPIAVWVSPDGTNCILDGHQRLRVIKELAKEGWVIPELPVAWIEADNEQHAKEKLLAAAGAFGEVSSQGLYELVMSADLDIERIAEMTRFREIDFEEFRQEFFVEPSLATEGLTDPDDVPENVETLVKPGELWILGNHRLLCGDSTKREDVERLMNGEKADMVFTDPPYGVSFVGVKGTMYQNGKKVGKNTSVEIKNDDLRQDDLTNLFSDSISLSVQFSKPNAPYYIFFAINRSLEVLPAIKNCGLSIRNWLIWDKGNVGFHAMGAQYKPNFESFLYAIKESPEWIGNQNQQTIWRHSVDRLGLHPTMKPVSLIEQAINNHPSKSVFDLFLGSGSTLIACEKTDRRCFGIEIDPHYCSVIVERWQQFTGKKAHPQ